MVTNAKVTVEDVKKTDGADTWEAVIHYHLIDKGDNIARNTVTNRVAATVVGLKEDAFR